MHFVSSAELLSGVSLGFVNETLFTFVNEDSAFVTLQITVTAFEDALLHIRTQDVLSATCKLSHTNTSTAHYYIFRLSVASLT